MVTYPKSLDQKLSGQGLSLTHHGVLGAQHRSWEREGVRQWSLQPPDQFSLRVSTASDCQGPHASSQGLVAM